MLQSAPRPSHTFLPTLHLAFVCDQLSFQDQGWPAAAGAGGQINIYSYLESELCCFPGPFPPPHDPGTLHPYTEQVTITKQNVLINHI